MPAYLATMCNKDGTTPLGECPEYEIEAADRYEAVAKFCKEYPHQEIISVGLKEQILAHEKDWGIVRKTPINPDCG